MLKGGTLFVSKVVVLPIVVSLRLQNIFACMNRDRDGSFICSKFICKIMEMWIVRAYVKARHHFVHSFCLSFFHVFIMSAIAQFQVVYKSESIVWFKNILLLLARRK